MAETFVVGAVVPLTFYVYNASGELADPTSQTLTVTPVGVAPITLTALHPSVGVFTYDYATTYTGRHVARLTATGANAGVDEDTFDVAALNLALVTIADLRAYLGDQAGQWSDADLSGALAAEQAAQSKRCRIDPFSADLREALMRRVSRNLSNRAVPLGVVFGGDTATNVAGVDPEVRRLEGPYRRLVLG